MTLGRHIDRHRRRVVRECGLNGKWMAAAEEEGRKKEEEKRKRRIINSIKKQSSTSPISPTINNMINFYYYDNTQ